MLYLLHISNVGRADDRTGRVHNSDRCAAPRRVASVVNAIHCRSVDRRADMASASTASTLPHYPGASASAGAHMCTVYDPRLVPPAWYGLFQPAGLTSGANTAYRYNLGRADNWTTYSGRVWIAVRAYIVAEYTLILSKHKLIKSVYQ